VQDKETLLLLTVYGVFPTAHLCLHYICFSMGAYGGEDLVLEDEAVGGEGGRFGVVYFAVGW
jgi:hypothetical protein